MNGKKDIGEGKQQKNIKSIPDKVASSIRKNLIASAFYQLIYEAVIIGLPLLIIYVIHLDMLVPIMTIENAPVWITIGGIFTILTLIQIIYGIFYGKLSKANFGRILGYIVAAFMLPFIPVGTFFGLMLISDLRARASGINYGNVEDGTQGLKTLGKNIAVSGLLMMQQPFKAAFLSMFLISLPLDMAYPIIRSSVYDLLDSLALLFFILYGLQFAYGVVLTKLEPRKWMKGAAIFFASVLILSAPIMVGAFFYHISWGLQVEYGLGYIGFLGPILGLLMNPLGIYFGAMILKNRRLITAERY